MANDYFELTTPLTRHTLGRAEQVNNLFSSVETGLEKLPDADPLNQGRVTYVADTGAANAYVVTLAKVPSSYVAGLSFTMKVSAANTGTSTVNVNALGVKTIKRYNGDNLEANDLLVGMLAQLAYDGTNFRLLSTHGSSEANAAASAAAAATSEANAATSETNAASSATAAQTARTGAETAETNAETAETNAAASEAAAATSESNAATSESNAATSETNAATSESNASTSASNASTSASNAATSESNASTSASNAATSEANAATSETNAEAHYENFLGVYYGALASDPATDPNGDAVGEGDWYFNTTTNRARIYNGTSFDDLGTASLSTFIYTAAGGETSLSGADDNGNALAYTAGFVQVFLNGARLTEGDDFTASNGTSITGLAALTVGDVVAVDAFSRFSVSDALLKTDYAPVDSLLALVSIDVSGFSGGERRDMRAFYSDTDTGGGPFYWDASRDKADANGGTIIDPATTGGFNGTTSTLAAYLAAQGTGSGTGCWVRLYDGLLNFVGYPISWFGGVSDRTTTNNSAAIQQAYDVAGTGFKAVQWDGQYGFSSTIDLPASTWTTGTKAQRRSATNTPESEMVWNGGASPMFTMAVTRVGFEGLQVTNLGTATDWIEANSGAMELNLDTISVAGDGGNTQFSRSFVRSNGNRLGYSRFDRIFASNAPAPILFDIDGQGSANGITTISLTRSLISNSAGDSMKVFNIKDESIEVLNIDNGNTFIDRGPGLTVVDTTDTPVTHPIMVLNIEGNEFEPEYGAGSGAMLDLVNVLHVRFNGNNIAGGGGEDRFGRLVNSNVVSFDGNYWRSLNGYFWDPDDDSFIVGGFNSQPDDQNQFSAHDNIASGARKMTIDPGAASIYVIPTQVFDYRAHTIVEADIVASGSYEFRAANSQAEGLPPGTVFTVVVRNTSGGAISAPTFKNTQFNLLDTTVAPADGNSRSHTFYYNGVKCIEVHRGTADVANA